MQTITQVLDALATQYGETEMARAFRDPFQFLVAVMLSARSKDSATIPVAKELFSVAPTPEAILKLPRHKIEKILHPIGFFRVKAAYVHGIARKIVECGTPTTFDELVSLPGVSRKTANVVLSQFYGQSAIAVDVHVHRITNRLGWVKTKTPEETEQALQKIVPKNLWKDINRLLVQHGQTTCLPRKPKCSNCPISQYCEKIGV